MVATRSGQRDWRLIGTQARQASPRDPLQFSSEVQRVCLDLKRAHKRWGANRVLFEMGNDPGLSGMKLPSRSRLYAYFRQHCPDCLNIWTKHKEVPPPVRATAVHEVWQLDHQEGHRLADGSIATVCNIRDPYGAAMIASQAFSVKTEQRWRKITWKEVRSVLRIGFMEWQTLPNSVLTDSEMGMGGNPTDPFPSWLSLYLAGLGIKHNFIRSHQPTDQPQIERNHRTLDGLTEDEHSRRNLSNFQQALDQERYLYNHQFPARSPVIVTVYPRSKATPLCSPHGDLICQNGKWYSSIFNGSSTFWPASPLERKVNRNGQVTLKGHHYTVGLAHKEKTIQVRLDPETLEWLFLERDEQAQECETQSPSTCRT